MRILHNPYTARHRIVASVSRPKKMAPLQSGWPHAMPAFQESLPAPTVSPRYEGDEKQDRKHDDPDRSNTERDNG
jgi:hypothetical protein